MTDPGREYIFGPFRLNVSTRQLWQESQEVTLPLKVFECLVYLIENRTRAVSRGELFENVWRNAHLTENVLDQTIFVLRRTLDDAAPGTTHIKTVRGFGYHWVASVEAGATSELDVSPPIPAEVPRKRVSGIRTRFVLLFLPVLAVLAALLLVRARWDSTRATDGTPRKSGAAIALVLPADVISAGGKSWIRYGAMDLVAERLRSAGLAVVPSETTIALMQRLDKQPGTDTVPRLRSATGADLVLRLQAREQDAGWSVTLRDDDSPPRGITARGEAADVFEAARLATDRLALSLGLTPPSAPTASPGGVALAQQIRAALLASQPEAASAMIENADEESKQRPEVRFQISRLDYYLERFDAAESQLRSLVEEPAVQQDPALHSRVIVGLSAFAFRRHDYATAEAQLQSALDLAKHGNHPDQACSIASKAGLISLMRGELDKARAGLAKAMLECEETGNIDELGTAQNALGALETVVGNLDSSIAYCREAAHNHARTYSVDNELTAQSNLVDILLEKMDLAAAALAIERLDQLLDQSRQPSKTQTARLEKALYLMARGKLSEAERLLVDMEHSANAPRDPNLLLMKGRLAANGGHPAESAELASEAVRAFVERGIFSETGAADAWLLLVRSRIALNQRSEARDALAAMSAWVASSHVPSVRLLLLLARAETANAEGQADDAASAYDALLPLVDAEQSKRLKATAVDSHVRWLLSPGPKRPNPERALAVANRIAMDDTYDSALVRLRIAQALGARAEWRKALARARELAGERSIPASLLGEPAPR